MYELENALQTLKREVPKVMDVSERLKIKMDDLKIQDNNPKQKKKGSKTQIVHTSNKLKKK